MVLRPTFALEVPERDAAEHGPLPIKLASLSPYTCLLYTSDAADE